MHRAGNVYFGWQGVVLPRSNKSTEYHGEHGHLYGSGEGLPARDWNASLTGEVLATCADGMQRLDLLQQESLKHHGEKNTEPPQNREHGQAEMAGTSNRVTFKDKTGLYMMGVLGTHLSRCVPKRPEI